MDNNIIQQENKFTMQEVFSRGECTASFDKDFYSELTKLKQQNIGKYLTWEENTRQAKSTSEFWKFQNLFSKKFRHYG